MLNKGNDCLKTLSAHTLNVGTMIHPINLGGGVSVTPCLIFFSLNLGGKG